jgi:hypothetical protein
VSKLLGVRNATAVLLLLLLPGLHCIAVCGSCVLCCVLCCVSA